MVHLPDSPPGDDLRRIVLATNSTFAKPEFQKLLRDGDHLLVVGDEMHRLGSKQALAALERCRAGGTLGLSATYRRQFDSDGTDALVAWFGDVLEPVVGIAEAIAMKRLVPYDYRLHTLELEPEEIEQYAEISDRIRRASRGNGDELSDYLQMLLIQRARILKQARGKAGKAIEILNQEFRPEDRWLVYCDDRGQLDDVVSAALEHDLPIMEFHSMMPGDRDAVLDSLQRRGGIVAAIRCLDEGVDLPACNRALILARLQQSRGSTSSGVGASCAWLRARPAQRFTISYSLTIEAAHLRRVRLWLSSSPACPEIPRHGLPPTRSCTECRRSHAARPILVS